MTEFDSIRYEQEVLRPLRRRQGPVGDADLVRRYALDPDMTAAALAARLDEVRAYWQRRAAVPDSIAEVCADLLQADQELRASAGRAMLDPAWWSRQAGGSAGMPATGQGQASGDPATDPAPVRTPTTPPPDAVATAVTDDGAGPQPTLVTFYRKWPAQTRRMLRDELIAMSHEPAAPVRTAAPTEEPAPKAPPPVTAAEVEYGPNRVRVTWVADPEAVAVRLHRRVGAPPEPTDLVGDLTTTGYDDPAGMAALPVYYGLTAVYADGRTAPPVVVAATPDDLVESLRGVTVTAVGGQGDRARVRISWPAKLGDAVRVHRCDRVPPVGDGEFDPDVVNGLGEPITGSVAEVPTGYGIYLPVLVAGGRAWAGPVVTLGVAEPVDGLAVERVGAGVLVTWRWPPQMTLADVEWADGWRRITRAEYSDRNGCPLPDLGLAEEVRVTGITVTADGELRAAAVTAPVPARRVRVRCEIRRGPIYRPASRVLRLTADADCDDVTVTVFAVPGAVMPLDPPEDAAVATVGPLRLRARVTESFPLSIPAVVHRSRPYWVVCRVPPGSDVTLKDPPVEQMKVV